MEELACGVVSETLYKGRCKRDTQVIVYWRKQNGLLYGTCNNNNTNKRDFFFNSKKKIEFQYIKLWQEKA